MRRRLLLLGGLVAALALLTVGGSATGLTLAPAVQDMLHRLYTLAKMSVERPTGLVRANHYGTRCAGTVDDPCALGLKDSADCDDLGAGLTSLCSIGGVLFTRVGGGGQQAAVGSSGSGGCAVKGDIQGTNGVTSVCVPVGADGKRLAADSTAAAGWSWRDDVVKLVQNADVSISNTTTKTDFAATPNLGVLVANTALHLYGNGTAVVTGTDTFTFRAELSGTVVGTFAVANAQLPTAASPYHYDITCVVRAGASTAGTVQCGGWLLIDDATQDATIKYSAGFTTGPTTVDILTLPVVFKLTGQWTAVSGVTAADAVIAKDTYLDFGVGANVVPTASTTTTTTTSTTTTTAAGGDSITDTNANNVQDWWTNSPPDIAANNAARQDIKGAAVGALTKIDACLGNAGSTSGTAFMQVYPGACPANGGSFGGAQLGTDSDAVNIADISFDISGSPNAACGAAGTGELMTFVFSGTKPDPGSADYCIVLRNTDNTRWATSGGSGTGACPGSTCYQTSSYDVWIPNSDTRPNQDYIFNVWRLP